MTWDGCDFVQVVLVSATLPNEVLQMTQQFMTDPVKILVKRDELTLEVSHGHHQQPSCGCHGLHVMHAG